MSVKLHSLKVTALKLSFSTGKCAIPAWARIAHNKNITTLTHL